jgi:acyl-CoA reductase-like NAD-dependent aldehyde dehydrogenase
MTLSGKRSDALADSRIRFVGSERPQAGADVSPTSDAVSLATRSADLAAAAFGWWSALGPTAKRTRLNAAADLLAIHSAEFAEVMAEEIGATRAWVDFNLSLSAQMLREAASLTTQIGGSIIPSNRPGVTAMGMRQPAGVVLGIAPWNAPIVLAVRAVAMPLACGNTAVLKASEICPRTHLLVGRVLDEAGIDNGAIQVVTNQPSEASAVVECLVGHPAIRRVNFTGSTRVGRLVAELAARHLKPALLELGGKAPLLVLDDADLEEAASAATFGAFMNQGQICMSTERLVVDDAVADVFADLIVRKAALLLAGNPRLSSAPLGPVVGFDAADRIDGIVKDAVSKGARILVGGRIDGTAIDATVIDHVTPNMRIYSEECFGPVVSMIRVHGDAEAIRVANDTEYGLSSAVFSRDLKRAMAVARQIESGICHINSATVEDEPQMPFGGMKASGYGRFGGAAAIEEFTELRWITFATQPRRYPI